MCKDNSSIEVELPLPPPNKPSTLSKDERIVRLRESIINIDCSIRWNKKYEIYNGENEKLLKLRKQKIEELNKLLSD